MRKAYASGMSSRAHELRDEAPDQAIVDTGNRLRQQTLDANRDKHRRANYRVLMLRPASITAEYWFGGLQECMQHAGIDCRVLPPSASAAEINACIEAFQPSILIATESIVTLRSMDLGFIADYKRHHGCLRLFIPVWNMPGSLPTPRKDSWRRRLRRRGLTVDAYFSIFEPEFHERFSADKAGPKFDYVTVPQACNPFSDRPMAERKSYDYFMAASFTDERLDVTYRFVRPIMERYPGLWAGPKWGFGMPGIARDDMPTHYARTRIALSPLVDFVANYSAELTHRVYAAAACGTFQLTMPTAITGRYFEPDELLQAGSPEEYRRLFEHYVCRPAERNEIAMRALRRAYGDHTWFNRVDRLVAAWDDWRARGCF